MKLLSFILLIITMLGATVQGEECLDLLSVQKISDPGALGRECIQYAFGAQAPESFVGFIGRVKACPDFAQEMSLHNCSGAPGLNFHVNYENCTEVPPSSNDYQAEIATMCTHPIICLDSPFARIPETPFVFPGVFLELPKHTCRFCDNQSPAYAFFFCDAELTTTGSSTTASTTGLPITTAQGVVTTGGGTVTTGAGPGPPALCDCVEDVEEAIIPDLTCITYTFTQQSEFDSFIPLVQSQFLDCTSAFETITLVNCSGATFSPNVSFTGCAFSTHNSFEVFLTNTSCKEITVCMDDPRISVTEGADFSFLVKNESGVEPFCDDCSPWPSFFCSAPSTTTTGSSTTTPTTTTATSITSGTTPTTTTSVTSGTSTTTTSITSGTTPTTTTGEEEGGGNGDDLAAGAEAAIILGSLLVAALLVFFCIVLGARATAANRHYDDPSLDPIITTTSQHPLLSRYDFRGRR